MIEISRRNTILFCPMPGCAAARGAEIATRCLYHVKRDNAQERLRKSRHRPPTPRLDFAVVAGMIRPSLQDHGRRASNIPSVVFRARNRRALGPLADLRIILFLPQQS